MKVREVKGVLYFYRAKSIYPRSFYISQLEVSILFGNFEFPENSCCRRHNSLCAENEFLAAISTLCDRL
jgi:hypothetical protein